MNKRSKEWLKQSVYDFDTAKYMFDGERYFYSAFMYHLSIEKALKGLYHHRLNDIHPKTHTFVCLLDKLNLKPEVIHGKFIIKLNEANVITRYPEELEEINEVNGDNQSVGYRKSREDFEYTNHTINLKKKDTFYLFSDGYIDQSGGEKRFPLGRKRFVKLLNENHGTPLQAQKEILIKAVEEYRGDEAQRDDITVLGFKVL